MSRAQKKGYDGERPVVDYLKKRGFFRAYRLRTQGTIDKGDVGGIDGVCVEIKNASVYAFPQWLTELARERIASRADTGAVVVKPRGIGETKVDQWWAVLPLETYVDLLIRAGYGPHDREKDLRDSA